MTVKPTAQFNAVPCVPESRSPRIQIKGWDVCAKRPASSDFLFSLPYCRSLSLLVLTLFSRVVCRCARLKTFFASLSHLFERARRSLNNLVSLPLRPVSAPSLKTQDNPSSYVQTTLFPILPTARTHATASTLTTLRSFTRPYTKGTTTPCYYSFDPSISLGTFPHTIESIVSTTAGLEPSDQSKYATLNKPFLQP